MSIKSDEFEQLNYSFISSEKNENVLEKEINLGTNDTNKKQILKKNFSSSSLNKKNKINDNIFPEINLNKKRETKLGKKMNLSSTSFNKLKNNSFSNKAYRTFNLDTNFIYNNKKQKNIKNVKEIKSENPEYIQTENNNKIKSESKSNNIIFNSVEQKPKLINILNSKNNTSKKEENDKEFFQDSQRIKKEYNNIQKDYVQKKNSIKSMKEEEKISKEEELQMKNKILTEQIKRLNYLYFDVLKKLIDYEESIKNIHKFKESKLKNEYILLELDYKYNQALLDLEKNNKKIEELSHLLTKKNTQLKQCQKNLDYYFQLNQKLLIDADNIYMSPKILALKNDYETKINENKKSLAFYKEENYKKDKILLELNYGNKNIEELYNSMNSMNYNKNDKNCYFKNAQKVSKEYFTKNKQNKENKEIINLKNKVNNQKEKIDILNKQLKEYEDKERCLKRYKSNNQKKTKKINYNNDDIYNFNKNNIKNNPPQLKIQKTAFINYIAIKAEEDYDFDFMSNLNMNEFLYVLKKCFESQLINIEDITNKILKADFFNILKTNNKSNYNIFINKISENFCKLLKIVKIKDKNDILSFVQTFLFNNYIENGSNIDEFRKAFINTFKEIYIYDKNSEEKYIKPLAKYFKDKIDKLKKEFEFIDLNQSGKISFIALKKVIEKLKINIKNDYLEYMIFFMKRASINDNDNINNYSLKDLNYKIFLDKISSILNSNDDLDISDISNLSEIENNNNFDGAFNPNITDDNSLIEITNEEYNEKLSLIMNSISSEIMKKSNKNTEEYINQLFSREITTDEIGHQIIELSKLIDEIKNSLFIQLNQIEIFCLYSRFQISDSNKKNITTELIDFKSFKNEILLYINQILNNKNSNQIIKEKNIIEKKISNENNDIKDINTLNDNNKEKNDEKEEINKQNEEYNDFEKNLFDNEI